MQRRAKGGCQTTSRMRKESFGSKRRPGGNTGSLCRLAIGFAGRCAPSRRTSHGTLCFCDRPRRRARHALARHVIWRGIGPGAGHVLAGTRPVRHATGLSEAFRELHTNRLLDGRDGEAVRLREAIKETARGFTHCADVLPLDEGGPPTRERRGFCGLGWRPVAIQTVRRPRAAQVT